MKDDFEIDDFYVGPPLIKITTIEHMKKFANEWLSDERKYMIVEIEEQNGDDWVCCKNTSV